MTEQELYIWRQTIAQTMILKHGLGNKENTTVAIIEAMEVAEKHLSAHITSNLVEGFQGLTGFKG